MSNNASPMYYIYKIDFYKDPERGLYNQDQNVDANLKIAEQLMLSLFDENTIKQIYKFKQDKDATIYPNDVMCPVRWNVVWWRVNNVQLKNLVRRKGKNAQGQDVYEDESENSYPYSHVVVDLRPEYLQIAIEKTPAWSNTDKLADVLQESFNRLMSSRWGVSVSISARMEPTKFWDYVHKQVYDNGDYIKKISFSFKNPKLARSAAGISKNSRLKQMARVAEMSGAIKSFYTMYFHKNIDKKKFSEKNRDLSEMVTLCGDKAYDLTVNFAKVKLYKSDEAVKACFPLPNNYLHAFSYNAVNINNTLDLIDWLDEIDKQIKNNRYVSDTPTTAD